MGVAGGALLVAGVSALGVAAASQEHAPEPARQSAGTTGPALRSGPPGRRAAGGSRSAAEEASRTSPAVVGPTLSRSDPVAIDIPAIGVSSKLQYVGLAPTGTIQVPPLTGGPLTNEAAWYDGSPTPGEVGPSVIEGHIDSAATGPSVFFELGSLVPGDTVDVTLADGVVGVFTVTGVRQYPKAAFPTATVYGNTDFAALHLITCGGAFDYTTHHYLANTVVFASLTSSHPVTGAAGGA